MLKPKDWTKHSRNERSVTVKGRHFFAGRCSFFWRLEEIDQANPNGSKLVKLIKLSATTAELSGLVMKEVQKSRTPREIGEALKPIDLKGLLSRPGQGDFSSAVLHRLMEAGLMNQHLDPTDLGYEVRAAFGVDDR